MNFLYSLFQFLQFLGVGCVNTILGLFIIFLAKYYGLNDVLSNFFGYFFGYIVGFFLNKKITFNNNDFFVPFFIRYTLVFIFSYSINIILVLILLEKNNELGFFAHLVFLPVFVILNFLGCKYFVYNQKK